MPIVYTTRRFRKFALFVRPGAEGQYARKTWSEIKALVEAYRDFAVISAFTEALGMPSGAVQ